MENNIYTNELVKLSTLVSKHNIPKVNVIRHKVLKEMFKIAEWKGYIAKNHDWFVADNEVFVNEFKRRLIQRTSGRHSLTTTFKNLFRDKVISKKENVIVMHSVKGGVGKTTTSILLSRTLADLGFKVLAIDFNPQVSFSTYMLETLEDNNVFTLLKDFAREGKPLSESAIKYAITRGKYKNIDIISGSRKLDFLNFKEKIDLSYFIDVLKNQYDVIIIDTQPSWSNLVKSIYSVASKVLCPTNVDGLCLNENQYTLERLITENINVDFSFIINNFKIPPERKQHSHSFLMYKTMITDDMLSPFILNTIIPTRSVYKEVTFYKNKKMTPKILMDAKKLLASLFFQEEEYRSVVGLEESKKMLEFKDKKQEYKAEYQELKELKNANQ